jgi:hypothetical protein
MLDNAILMLMLLFFSDDPKARRSQDDWMVRT